MKRNSASVSSTSAAAPPTYAVFTDGAIRHTKVIPIAGDQVTNDIATALRTPRQHAEEIKIRHACALSSKDVSEDIEVPSIGERPARQLSRQNLAQVVEARYEELLGLLQDELRRSGFEERVAGGVVLTGGSARTEGLLELAENVFHMPVRLGLPQYVTGLDDAIADPAYATGVGLLIYAQQHRFAAGPDYAESKGLWGRMREWFRGNF